MSTELSQPFIALQFWQVNFYFRSEPPRFLRKVAKFDREFTLTMPRTKKSVSFNALDDDSNPKTPPPYVEKYALKLGVASFPIHGLLVLLGMYSGGLTQNVKPVLSRGLATLTVLQLVYGYLVAVNTELASSKKKIKSENVPLLVSGAMVIAYAATLPVFVVMILMGAPLSSHITETALFAGHFSVLVLFPMLVFHRFETDAIFSVITAANGTSVILKNPILLSIVGAVLGTWVGVFPIPLDWDRDWQQWPITLLTGAYIGATVGSAASAGARAVLT